MGTLLKQEPRINALKYFASEKETIDWCYWIDKQAKDLGWKPADVLKAFELQELEKANALALRDGDAKDEQLSGFGELFQELIFALRGFPEDGWSDWHSNAARGAVINLDLPKPEPPEGFKIKTG